jgi:hypothetical protein
MNVDCSDNAFDQVVLVAHGETKTIVGIPQATTCTVSETTPIPPAGFTYKTPTITPQVTIGNGTTEALSVTNVLVPIPVANTGNLSIKKTVTGGTDPQSFSIIIDCSDDSFDQTITLKHNETKTIANIPEGATCSATETTPTPPAGFTYKAPTITPQVTIVDGKTVDIGVTNELVPSIPPAQPYHIGTHFWIDDNKDGKYDKGVELPIGEALVELLNEDRKKLYWTDENNSSLTTTPTPYPAQTRTTPEGEYGFDVPAGTYKVRFHIPDERRYDGYIFSNELDNDNDNDNINTTNSKGVTKSVTVGPNNKTQDLTLDAGINCECADTPIQANGGDALDFISILILMMLTLGLELYFTREEKENA